MTARTLVDFTHEKGKDKIEDSANHIIGAKHDNNNSVNETKNKETFKMEIVWKNVILFATMHVVYVYGILLLLRGQCTIGTFIFNYLYGIYGGLSVTIGAHRLWAHRAYSATLPFRIFLMIGHTIAIQNDLYIWTRDHRVHHKFTDLNADPHNSKRGFFFSHMGWLMLKKHPDVMEKGKLVDMSDLLQDPVVRFQRKYYIPLVFILSIALPIFVTHYFFEQTIWTSILAVNFRLLTSLHITWLVNSGAHMWGMKPYDKSINPTDHKTIAWMTMGEGWHNYHHVFPWDYKAAELGNYKYNFSTFLLDCAGKLGLAYNFKTASDEMIKKRVLRTGDPLLWSTLSKDSELKFETDMKAHHREEQIWGWGDKDMKKDEIMEVKRSCKQKVSPST
ncbi:acyl-CoA Delta-9 desaturase-like [Euwallacea similis]|uniref:acyl-CoA Delta-9 desaturase-like n=1 Tax=Euwallacea similis TaxID=1736056 RepID=UPI00344C6B97